MHTIVPDDIVPTHADAEGNARPPLLVREPLERFLDARDLGTGTVETAPIGARHSNVTCLVRREGWEGVVRRPPRPPWPPRAHDVLREARVLRALHSRAGVPAVLAACPDPGAIGAPSSVMERVEGDMVTGAPPVAFDPPDERRRLGAELVDALVELHAVDPRAPGLGDVRLGDAVVPPEAPARVVAVLAREMATIGDPLADLGCLTTLRAEPGDPSLGAFELAGVTRGPGFARRAELVARSEERSGRAARALRRCMEGTVRRAQAGPTHDPDLRGFGDSVVLLAERAEALGAGA